MRVLLFGTYDTSLHPRVATMAEGLRAEERCVALPMTVPGLKSGSVRDETHHRGFGRG